MIIETIKCLQDNYSYIIVDKTINSACVIDPSEALPIIEFLEKNKINLDFILNTHHHYDHVGGYKALKEKYDAKVLGFFEDKERIPEIDILLKDNEIWKNNNFEAKIIHIPGHTSGHICYYFKKEKIAFTGDTLFSMGCGRIFEGTYDQMYNSLNKLKKLPMDTKIFCGHEYTFKNILFCIKHDKENEKLKKKFLDIKEKINQKIPTVPSMLSEELDCNIFLRAKNIEDFSKLRDLKDNF